MNGAHASPASLPAGPRYELLVKIATGGMATVYVGRRLGSAGFARLVAIKRPHPHLREDPAPPPQLVREAQRASRLHHANVVSTLDVEEAGEELRLVMEYVEGGSLAELLDDELRPPSDAVRLRVLLDAAAGLRAVHELTDDDGRSVGLVHRDVSPQNILVGVDGTARLTDFGLAKLTEVSMTSSAGMQGKVAYMAPEYLRGGRFHPAADQFSFAVVAWETLAGRRLFKGAHDADTLRRVLEEEPPRLSSVAPRWSAGLDTVLARALRKNPERRFGSVAEFADALRREAPEPSSSDAVGEAVRATLGRRLDQRRELIAAVLDPERSNTASLVDALPVDAPPANVAAMPDPDHTVPLAYLEEPEPDKPLRRWWPIVLIVAAGLGAATVVSRSESESAHESREPNESDTESRSANESDRAAEGERAANESERAHESESESEPSADEHRSSVRPTAASATASPVPVRPRSPARGLPKNPYKHKLDPDDEKGPPRTCPPGSTPPCSSR